VAGTPTYTNGNGATSPLSSPLDPALAGAQPSSIQQQPPIVAQSPIDPKLEDALFKALVARGKKDPGKLEFESIEEEQQLVERVIRDFEDADSGSRNYKRNVAEMWANWRMTTEPKDFPFDGCANTRVPLTSVFVETMLGRIVKAILGGEFVAKVSLLDKQVAASDLDEMNAWFKWELETVVKLRNWLTDALRNVLITGIDIDIPAYCTETRYLHSTREFELTNESSSLLDFVEQSLKSILDEPSDWGVDQPLAVIGQPRPGEYLLNDDGRIVFSMVVPNDGSSPPEVGRKNQSSNTSPTLKADIWKRETIFDGVKIHQVQLEDLVVSNTAGTIEDLPFLGIRCWYLGDDYRQKLEDGFFIDHGEEENKRIVGGAWQKTGEAIEHPITDLQDRVEGTDSIAGSSTDTRFVEVYRWEGWWSWDESRHDSSYIDRILQPATQVAVWVAVQSRRVIKICRLEDLNKDGKRSAIKFGFIHEPGRFYDMGLAEWIRHSQTTMDAINNQRLDSGLLYNVPFGFYKPTAGMAKSAQPISIEPGKFFPVADPQGINMPRTNWQPSFSFAEEQLVKQYAGEQAGLSGGATGNPISKRQSASEYVGTASALDLRTEGFVNSLLDSLQELLHRVLGLYQQFGPRQRIFRVGGEGGVQLTKKFEKDRLQGKLLLTMLGNLAQINEQLQRQVALDMLQLLLNPLLIQMQITGPDTV